MINVNPYVIDCHRMSPHEPLPNGEDADGDWYSVTEKLPYLPSFIYSFSTIYAFLDTPTGVIRHSYAPLGLELKSTWCIDKLDDEVECGAKLDNETRTTVRNLKEHVEMQCHSLLRSFVQSAMENAHSSVVKSLLSRAGASVALFA